MKAERSNFIVFFKDLVADLVADGEDIAWAEGSDWRNDVVIALGMNERFEEKVAVNKGTDFVR